MVTHQRRLSVAFFDAYSHVLGGSHQIQLTLATMLRQSSTVHFLTTAEGAFTNEIEKLGFQSTVVRLPEQLMSYGHSLVGKRALGAAALLPRAWGEIRRHLPQGTDVLHANDLRGVLLAGPAARSRSIPTVWHIHLGDQSAVFNRAGTLISSRIVVPDMTTVQPMPGVAFGKVRVVPNAVQPDALDAPLIDRGRRLLVTASRLVPQKGLDVLLDAVTIVKQEISDVELHIYGSDQRGYEDYATTIRTRSRDGALRDTVSLKGHQEHPYRSWSGAAIYVQSSLWENYPVAILEAMAVGLPVVATDVGAVAEIVEHNKTGLVVPPNNAHALANAIVRLLKTPSVATEMAVAARQRVLRDFAPSSMSMRMLAIYRELAKR